MATSTTQKWLIGCGIGCATLVVLIAGLVTSGVFFVRSKFQPLQDAAESRKTVVSAYGATESYVPPASGAIAPDRMEGFIAVREALREVQTKTEAGLAALDADRLREAHPSFMSVLKTLNDMSNVIVPFGEFMKQRNQILLDKRMGLGEYAYIYSIAYHSWLGHEPNEGPPILEKLRVQNRGASFDSESNISPEVIRREYHRVMLRLLTNQMNSLKDAESPAWRAALKEEIDRIERNPDRVAWQDNLPPAMEASLEPYRSRLVSTYYNSTNFLEFLALEDFNQGRRGFPRAESEGSSGGYTGPAEAPETKRSSDAKVTVSSEITYEVESGMTAPVPVRQPLPEYTDQARKANARGVVSVQAMVRRDGSVTGIRVVKSMRYGLDESVTETLSSGWKFKPGMRDGAAADVRARIDIRFR